MDLRNLDQIREHDGEPSASRLGPWLLGALGLGAIVLTAVMSMPEQHVPAESNADPLAALIEKAKAERSTPPDQLAQEHASFAQILSDKERASTALVAVRASDGRLIQPAEQPALPPAPPPGDELPVVPLPAGKLLEATRLTAEPQDSLAGLAAERAQVPANSERAEPGGPGDYQIQVASFREKAEADAYVEELRLRGHQAYSQAARVPNRGIWHRVRIGPFKNKAKAIAYKADFEAKEGMSAFFVDPEKVERRENERAAKAAAAARASQR